MNLLTLYFLAGICPSIAIYYFSYGNYPVAFKLQTGYFLLLLVLFIGAFLYFLNTPSSAGRHSNPIGYAGPVIAIFIFIIPMLLAVGGVALFYRDVPVSEPALAHTIIKWAFFVILLAGMSLMAYYYMHDRYIKAITYLPDFARQAIYNKLVTQDKLSYDIKSQLEKNIENLMTGTRQSKELLILSQDFYLLRDILVNRILSKNETPIIRENRLFVAKHVCKNRKESGYPNEYGFKDILSRLKNDEIDNPEQIIMAFLDCLEPADLRQVGTMFSNNDDFIRLVWTQYKFMRPHYIHFDADKQIEIIEEILMEEKILENKDKILRRLSYLSEYTKNQTPGYEKIIKYLSSLP